MAQRRFRPINYPQSSAAEVNDLSSAVTWADIPDANVPESAVTQHEDALDIAIGQVSGFTDNSSNWNTAYGWGDHSLAGYAPTSAPTFTGQIRGNSMVLLTGTYCSFIARGGTGTAFLDLHGDAAAFIDFSLDGSGATDYSARLRYYNDYLRVEAADFKVAQDFYVALDSTFSGDVDIVDGELTISSDDGDAAVYLKADTDNNNEAHNPFIRFEQDGNAVSGVIGISGAAGEDAQGNTFVNQSDNSFGIHHLFGTGTIGLGVGNNVALKINGSEVCTFYGQPIYNAKGGFLYYDSSSYASGKITVSSTAPSSPSQGDLWFDTS